MKLLLTSAGIKNASIHAALLELLGKPITECSALRIPTASYANPGGAGRAWNFIAGREPRTPMCELGWKSLGVLELPALPSIAKADWVPAVQQTDVLLVNGGDPLYLCHWMRESGLADLLPALPAVYVGLSAGSMVMAQASGRISRAGVRPPAATARLDWSISRSFRTSTTRCCRKTQWPTRSAGRPACRRRLTRLTMKPRSK